MSNFNTLSFLISNYKHSLHLRVPLTRYKFSQIQDAVIKSRSCYKLELILTGMKLFSKSIFYFVFTLWSRCFATDYTFVVHAIWLVEWLYLQGTFVNNLQTKVTNQKCSLVFNPIFNQVQKLRCCICITGALYCTPVYNMCGGSLTAELSIFDRGRLEVTAALLSYGCCKGLLDCTVNPVCKWL